MFDEVLKAGVTYSVHKREHRPADTLSTKAVIYYCPGRAGTR